MGMLKLTKLDKLGENERIFLEQEIKLLQDGYEKRNAVKLEKAYDRLKNLYHSLSDEAKENAKIILVALKSAIRTIKLEEDYDT